MLYFIVNPGSGSGRGMEVWKTVRKELDRMEVPYKKVILKRPGHGTEVAGKVKRGTIVVVGGDGTINEVVNGIRDFRAIQLGCIPTGSGNDFVRGMHLETDPIHALHRILEPQRMVELTVGLVRAYREDEEEPQVQKRFLISSGAGYDADVCAEMNSSEVKTKLNHYNVGKLGYFAVALKRLFSMKPSGMTVEFEDGNFCHYKHTYFAAAMNLPYEGGGFYFSPESRPDDDAMELILAEGRSKLSVLFLLPLALAGKHVGKRGIHILPFSRARIHSEVPTFLHTDGETYEGLSDFVWEMEEEKLCVITG